MKKLFYFLILSLIMVSVGCIKNAGVSVTETREVSDFKSIKLLCSADVYITQSSDYEVKVKAGENHIEYLETMVEEGVLKIDDSSNRFWMNEDFEVWVSANYLESIKIAGSGDIEGEGFESNELEVVIEGSGDIDVKFENMANYVDVSITGSGDIEIAGESKNMSLRILGSGDFEGKNLINQSVEVDIDGSGDAEVWAETELNINIVGSGDVYYYGDPASVNTSVSGSGNIKKR